jgi:hypothetical protein
MTPQEIYEEAEQSAADAFRLAMIEHDPMGGLCGTAWIVVRPARGPFISYLKSKGIGETGVYGGWEITVATPPEYRGQNSDIKEAGVRAFARVLKENGLKAAVCTRLT